MCPAAPGSKLCSLLQDATLGLGVHRVVVWPPEGQIQANVGPGSAQALCQGIPGPQSVVQDWDSGLWADMGELPVAQSPWQRLLLPGSKDSN